MDKFSGFEKQHIVRYLCNTFQREESLQEQKPTRMSKQLHLFQSTCNTVELAFPEKNKIDLTTHFLPWYQVQLFYLPIQLVHRSQLLQILFYCLPFSSQVLICIFFFFKFHWYMKSRKVQDTNSLGSEIKKK